MRDLSLNEVRVLGALIEKEITTPDQYPLSLNALANACNQKSNREPVLELSETEVQQAVDALQQLGIVSEVRIGARVAKFKHRYCNTEFSSMHLPRAELALLCLLLLRGPQTPGELRSRAGRLYTFKSVEEAESSLHDLVARTTNPLVCKLPREPGRRELRYMHLLSGEPDLAALQAAATVAAAPTIVGDYNARISALEHQVAQLQEKVDGLQALWDGLNN